MKKITYVDCSGNKKTVECEDFAVGGQKHDGCALSFLGALIPNATDGRREITHQVYGVKEWWLENA